LTTQSQYIRSTGPFINSQFTKHCTSKQSYFLFLIRHSIAEFARRLLPIGMLHRSGMVCLCHIKFVCDNSTAIIEAKRTVTQSIFHRLESDYNLISTMKFLQGNWCKDYDITYKWVNGHADRGNEEPNKEKRLNIEADELCDVIHNEATGPLAARGNCALREPGVCQLFITGSKIASNMKSQLQSQVQNTSMRKYLTQREIWTDQQFEGIDWTSYGTAFRRMGRSRQTAIAKAYNNLCHTSMKHNQYCGETRGCCMCGNAQEDWRHVISCRELDADLNRADSREDDHMEAAT
jgi:hypothetical protein